MNVLVYIVAKNASRHIEAAIGQARLRFVGATVTVVDCLSEDDTGLKVLRQQAILRYTGEEEFNGQFQAILRMAQQDLISAPERTAVAVQFLTSDPHWMRRISQESLNRGILSDLAYINRIQTKSRLKSRVVCAIPQIAARLRYRATRQDFSFILTIMSRRVVENFTQHRSYAVLSEQSAWVEWNEFSQKAIPLEVTDEDEPALTERFKLRYNLAKAWDILIGIRWRR